MNGKWEKLRNLHCADAKHSISHNRGTTVFVLATAVNKLGINIEMFVPKIMSCCLIYSKRKYSYKKKDDDIGLFDFPEIFVQGFFALSCEAILSVVIWFYVFDIPLHCLK